MPSPFFDVLKIQAKIGQETVTQLGDETVLSMDFNHLQCNQPFCYQYTYFTCKMVVTAPTILYASQG